MAAVVWRGGSLLSVAANGSRYGQHAETRALRPHQDFTGATMLVVRDPLKGCSRPCAHCWERIRASGIRYVMYVEHNGKLVKEKVTPKDSRPGPKKPTWEGA